MILLQPLSVHAVSLNKSVCACSNKDEGVYPYCENSFYNVSTFSTLSNTKEYLLNKISEGVVTKFDGCFLINNSDPSNHPRETQEFCVRDNKLKIVHIEKSGFGYTFDKTINFYYSEMPPFKIKEGCPPAEHFFKDENIFYDVKSCE